MKRFGVSTHLYHGERLRREHLAAIAAQGFDSVELFATKAHFDYHDPKLIEQLARWLDDARLDMPSVHAPIVDSLVGDKWGRAYSTASRDPAAWQDTMREMQAALGIAQQIPFKFFVVHLGLPKEQKPGVDDNSREAAMRTIEQIYGLAEPLGVKLALEVMDNKLSTVTALMELLENDLEGLDLRICMDVGHAFMLGDLGDAIELTSGYLATTHFHDNHRTRDEHLVPFEGSIDWPGTMMAFEKIGYDGVLMFEVRNTDGPARVLERASRARTRLTKLIGDWSAIGEVGLSNE